MTAETNLCHTWAEIPKTGFLASMFDCSVYQSPADCPTCKPKICFDGMKILNHRSGSRVKIWVEANNMLVRQTPKLSGRMSCKVKAGHTFGEHVID